LPVEDKNIKFISKIYH